MHPKDTVLLDHLQIGQPARIWKLELGPMDAQRLMEMGLTVGAHVRILRRAPLKYPVVVQARGSQFSLRKPVAKAIWVKISEGG